MKALLPSLIGPTTFIELFHSILDLPLLCAALIKLKYEEPRESIPIPENNNSQENRGENSQYHVLYNYLLRNESGVTINWWSYSTTRPLIDLFCLETRINPHIEEVMSCVPPLLEIYFDVLIAYADQSCLSELIPLLFDRLEQTGTIKIYFSYLSSFFCCSFSIFFFSSPIELFPNDHFEADVRKVLVTKLVAMFEKHPIFVNKHAQLLLSELSRNSPARKSIVLHICWIIGEYATPATCDSNMLNDFDETLELLVFELMSSISDHMDPDYANELMCVLISSLSKLAAVWTPLSSRVELCLHKIERYQNQFHESVICRAMECLNILKFPSIAAAVMGTRQAKHPTDHHIDPSSSLPFLLLPIGMVPTEKNQTNQLDRQPLHLFSI